MPIRSDDPSPISCGPNILDIQETAKYTPRHKKEVLINSYASQDVLEQEIVKIYATESRRSAGDPLTDQEREKYPPTQKTIKQQEHSRQKGKKAGRPKGYATGGTVMSESNLTPSEKKEIIFDEKGVIYDASVVGGA